MSENVINLLKPINPSWYLFALEILKSSATLPLQRKVVIFLTISFIKRKKKEKLKNIWPNFDATNGKVKPLRNCFRKTNISTRKLFAFVTVPTASMNTIQILTSVIVTNHSVWKESARYFLFTEIKEKVLRLLVMKVGERVSSSSTSSTVNTFRCPKN